MAIELHIQSVTLSLHQYTRRDVLVAKSEPALRRDRAESLLHFVLVAAVDGHEMSRAGGLPWIVGKECFVGVLPRQCRACVVFVAVVPVFST